MITALDHKTAAICLKNQPFKWDLVFILNSCLDPKEQEIFNESKKYSKSQKSYWFDDIDCPLYPYLEPTEGDVKSILKYAQEKKNVMIACSNGMTRSVSLAYVIRCIKESPEMALTSITKKRSHPNELIVRTAATSGDQNEM